MNLEVTFSQLEGLEAPFVLDIRAPEQFAYGTWPGAVNIPKDKLKPEELRPPVYLLCQSGIVSLELAERFREMGIEAYSVQGGYREYLRRSLTQAARNEELRLARQQKAEHSIRTTYRKELWTPFIKARTPCSWQSFSRS